MVVRAITIILVIFGCYSIQSCAVLGVFPRERLRIDKINQIKNIDRVGLKVDGVYIGEHTDDRKNGVKSFFILYNDGLCYFIVNWSDVSAESIVSYLENNSLSNDSPIGWGVFDIHSNTIHIANWQVMKSTIEYNRLTLNGKILDSETTVIEKGWGFENETAFHFYPLKNKPDSTNRFIK